MWWMNFVVAAALFGGTVHEQRDGRIGIFWNTLSHVIHRVCLHSPAERAGLLPGDRILHTYEFNEKPIVGSVVQLTIQRDKHEFTVLIERVATSEIDMKHSVRKQTNGK